MITLATYNIQFGTGRDGRFDLERIVATVAAADIIALQEVEVQWQRSGDHDIVAMLRSLLHEHYCAWGANIDMLKQVDGAPAGPHAPRRQQGNMILSRFPILSIRNHLLPKYGAVGVLDFQRGALEAVIATPIGQLRVFSTFFCHLSENQRLLQIERLQQIIEHSRTEGPPIAGVHARDPSWSSEATPLFETALPVVMGDCNLVPNGPAYNRLVGELNPKHGRLRRRGGLADCWDVAPSKLGLAGPDGQCEGATLYPGWPPEFGTGRRIDYVFVDESLAPRVREARVLPMADGSDHVPLFVTLE